MQVRVKMSDAWKAVYKVIFNLDDGLSFEGVFRFETYQLPFELVVLKEVIFFGFK